MTITGKVTCEETRTFNIPVKPRILVTIRNIISDRESNITDLVDVISKDVYLTSQILETINSPSFGLDKKIQNIRHAVCLVGTHAINDVATTILFKRAVSKFHNCLSLERFWLETKDVAHAMAFINKNHYYQLSDEFSYIIGFFHDCGVPAFYNKFDDYKETLILCNEQGCNSVILEVNNYKTNHAVVGYLIATYWHLPDELCNIILNHHDIKFLDNTCNINEQFGFATLKLAEQLVHRNSRYCDSPDWKHVVNDVLNLLKIDKSKYTELEKHYFALIL